MWNSHDPFWLERPTVLLTRMKLIPKDNMKLADQMNALTRLIVLFFLVMYLLGFKDATLFLFLSLVFIIILYYLQKNQMSSCENYEPESVLPLPAGAILPRPTTRYVPQTFSPIEIPQNELAQQNSIAKSDHLYRQFLEQPRVSLANHPSYYNQQVGKVREILPDQRYVSSNQKLVGCANPKTLMKPIVAPPAYEWTYWKDNDFVLPPQINTRSVQDYYASGYYVDEPPVEMNEEMDRMASEPIVENYSHTVFSRPSHSASLPSSSQLSSALPRSSSQMSSALPRSSLLSSSALPRSSLLSSSSRSDDIVEHFQVSPTGRANDYFRAGQRSTGVFNACEKDKCSYNYNGVTPIERDNGDFVRMKKRDEPYKSTGDLDDALAYDASNLDYNLPSNYPASNCQRSDNMKGHNRQVFTSTVLPGVYYNSQIIEPISSNIGISFTQQIPAREAVKDEYGNVVYEARDPRQYKAEAPVKPEFNVPSTYDVYDPRFDGYGTADRSYTDKMTGQPRFFYDDVDAIRKPNYVSRSNVDFLCAADTYGPILGTQQEKRTNEQIRQVADQSFTDNTLDFRTDMMTRLMRKRNAELWQSRMAPKTTMKK